MLNEKWNVILTENKLKAIHVCFSRTSEQSIYQNLHSLYSKEIFKLAVFVSRSSKTKLWWFTCIEISPYKANWGGGEPLSDLPLKWNIFDITSMVSWHTVLCILCTFKQNMVKWTKLLVSERQTEQHIQHRLA